MVCWCNWKTIWKERKRCHWSVLKGYWSFPAYLLFSMSEQDLGTPLRFNSEFTPEKLPSNLIGSRQTSSFPTMAWRFGIFSNFLLVAQAITGIRPEIRIIGEYTGYIYIQHICYDSPSRKTNYFIISSVVFPSILGDHLLHFSANLSPSFKRTMPWI